MSRAVELHQAFVWTCEDCGRDNFEHAITVSPEMADQTVSVSLGGYPAFASEWLAEVGGGTWLMAPARVTCKHCQAEFGAVES